MTILDQLTGCARERTVQAKLRISLEELKQQALSLPKGNFTFEKAIKNQDFLYLRVQKILSIQRDHCSRVSISADCKGL